MDVEWLKDELQAKGISQAEIARLLGVTQGKVSKMLSGALQIKSADADRLRRHLGYQLPEDLVPGSTDQKIVSLIAELTYQERQLLELYLEALTGIRSEN